MTCGLVHASYGLPEWQAVKLTFFAPRRGEVTLEVFPKASHREIVWAGLALGSDHIYDCGHTAINCPRGRKNLKPVTQEKSSYRLKADINRKRFQPVLFF